MRGGIYVGDFDGELVVNLFGYLNGYSLRFAVVEGVGFIVGALYVGFIVGLFVGIILGCNVGYFEGVTDGTFISEILVVYKYEGYSVRLFSFTINVVLANHNSVILTSCVDVIDD